MVRGRNGRRIGTDINGATYLPKGFVSTPAGMIARLPRPTARGRGKTTVMPETTTIQDRADFLRSEWVYAE
jgi:hypothetical protein